MVAQRRILLALLALPLAIVAACDKVPLLAPTGSVITLLPATNTVNVIQYRGKPFPGSKDPKSIADFS